MKKRIMLLIVTMVLVLAIGQTAFAAINGETAKVDKKTTIYLFGKKVKADIINYKNELYVPLKDACIWFNCGLRSESDGKNVELNSSRPNVNGASAYSGTLLKNKKSVAVAEGISDFKIDNMKSYLSSITYKTTVFVPIEYFSEILGAKTTWQKSKSKFLISKFSEKNIGTVNEENITERELDFNYYFALQNVEAGLASPELNVNEAQTKKTAFDLLAKNKIIDGKIPKESYRLGERDYENINEHLVAVVRKYKGIDAFKTFLESHNLTMAQVFNEFKAEYYREIFARIATRETEATEGEIAKYYDENKSTLKRELQVRAKHILISIADTQGTVWEEKKANAKNKALEILNSVKSGENFDKLMNEFSGDPGTKTSPNGYTFGKGVMVKEFEDAAFALKAGEISGLVETVYGYHVIKVEEVFPERVLTLDEAKLSIENKLNQSKKLSAWNIMLQKWTDESKITNSMN